MAAGMGSRFGGLKQIASVDAAGHPIIDLSMYDAYRAGFRDVVFIIKREMEADFREVVGNKAEQHFNVSYVYQELDRLPEGYSVPEGREKPWGTGHAIACCKGVVDGPFAVINADDYYGKEGFVKIYDFLTTKADASHNCMVGFEVEKTLSENGTVSRGICKAADGKLTDIVEHLKVAKEPELNEDGSPNPLAGKVTDTHADGTKEIIPSDSPVSMNLWGFGAEYMEYGSATS
jgi:dTDP-glucose pyrophosphorylase